MGEPETCGQTGRFCLEARQSFGMVQGNRKDNYLSPHLAMAPARGSQGETDLPGTLRFHVLVGGRVLIFGSKTFPKKKDSARVGHFRGEDCGVHSCIDLRFRVAVPSGSDLFLRAQPKMASVFLSVLSLRPTKTSLFRAHPKKIIFQPTTKPWFVFLSPTKKTNPQRHTMASSSQLQFRLASSSHSPAG